MSARAAAAVRERKPSIRPAPQQKVSARPMKPEAPVTSTRIRFSLAHWINCCALPPRSSRLVRQSSELCLRLTLAC